jgi:hypothetical protein
MMTIQARPYAKKLSDVSFELRLPYQGLMNIITSLAPINPLPTSPDPLQQRLPSHSLPPTSLFADTCPTGSIATSPCPCSPSCPLPLPLLCMPLSKPALLPPSSMVIHMRMVRNHAFALLFVVFGFQRHGVFEIVCCLVEGVVVCRIMSWRYASYGRGDRMAPFLSSLMFVSEMGETKPMGRGVWCWSVDMVGV